MGGKWTPVTKGVNNPAKGVSSWGEQLGASDMFGNKERTRSARGQNAADEQRVTVKADADAASIAEIDKKQKATAKEVADNNAATSTALGVQATAATAAKDKLTKALLKDDPVALAKQLSIDADELAVKKSAFADEKLAHADKLTGLYSQLHTSYDDIGKKYADAVTGLSDVEKQQYRGTAQADFSAMSAVGAQGNDAAMRGSGRPVTGQMAAVLSAQSQQGAASAYASAIQNMQNLDTQRRQMQESIVTHTLDEQRSNVDSAGRLMSTQIAFQDQALTDKSNYLQQAFNDKSGLQTRALETDINKNLSEYGAEMGNIGFQTSIGNQQGVLRNDTLASNLNADTYADTAGIALRNGVYTNQNAQGATAEARTGGAFAKDMAVAGLGIAVGTGAASAAAKAAGAPTTPTP
jgi:hypothetical protein